MKRRSVVREFPASPAVLSEIDPGVITAKTSRVARYNLQAAFFNDIAVPQDVLRPFLNLSFRGVRYALALAPAAEILPEL
jgi:hypothetical protein